MEFVNVDFKISSSTDQNNFSFKFPISDEDNNLKSLINVVSEVDKETNAFLTSFVENGKLSPNKLTRCHHGFPYSQKECVCSPSHWMCPNDNAKPNEVIPRYVGRMLNFASDLKKCPIEGEFDVACGRNKSNDNTLHRMDIYGTTVLPNNSPIFAFIHGGYWQEGSKEVAKSMVRSLVSSGIIVAVIGYDLAPVVSIEAITAEISESINYLNSFALERNANGLYIAGHSAGAHLAFMGLLRSECPLPSVRGAVLLAGCYNLEPLLDTYLNEALKLDVDAARRNSPEMYVEEFSRKFSRIKVAIVVGQYDSPFFLENSEKLARRFNIDVIDTTFVVIKNEDHFSMIENLADMNSEIFRFICSFIQTK